MKTLIVAIFGIFIAAGAIAIFAAPIFHDISGLSAGMNALTAPRYAEDNAGRVVR